MEFKRIDNETVRCIIDEEDMKEYNIAMCDFMKDRGKVQDFLHKIVEIAAQEVGYNPKHGMLAMQVVPLSQSRLAITFSEKETLSIEEFLQQVKESLGENKDIGPEEMIQQFDGMSHEEKARAFDKFIKNAIEDAVDEQVEAEYQKQNTVLTDGDKKTRTSVLCSDKAQYIQIYSFPSIDEAALFCQVIPDTWNIKSEFYKDTRTKTFYLVLQKGRVSDVNFKKIYEIAPDFTRLDSKSQVRYAFIQEHFECIIQSKAIKVLKKMR